MSISISMTEMLQAGVHYGHRKSRWHPKMKEYIYGTKNNIHVIDLNKSVLRFVESLTFLKDSAARGKNILLVGTKPQAAEIIKKTAENCDMPYVVNRWLGGTLTNFKTIKGSIRKMKDLEEKLNKGGFDVLTKKEKLDKTDELEKMQANLGGLKSMTKLPDVVFVTDLKKDIIAIREAKFLRIPVVGIADTNANPDLVDYIIPGNDDSQSSLEYIYEKVAESINIGKENPVIEKKKEVQDTKDKKEEKPTQAKKKKESAADTKKSK